MLYLTDHAVIINKQNFLIGSLWQTALAALLVILSIAVALYPLCGLARMPSKYVLLRTFYSSALLQYPICF